MFKSPFSALEKMKEGKKAADVLSANKDAAEFIHKIKNFPFYPSLAECLAKAGEQEDPESLLEYLLTEKGLN